MTLVLRLLLLGVFALPLTAAPTEKSQALLIAAASAEADRKFDKALDLYLRSYLGGERTGDIRDRIHDCLRQAAQTRRHRDPAFRKYVQELPPGDALNLYAEIVTKLSTHHAEKEKATPERLFTLSLQEIERALRDAAFRKTHLPQAKPERLASFTRSLREPPRLPATAKEARAALQELVRAAQNQLDMAEVSPMILEAICGASGGLDESTVYVPPAPTTAKVDEPTVTRAEIVDMLSGVGLIAVVRFSDATTQEFEQSLGRLKMQGLRALVLDLRGNSGGSLLAALQLAERFVPGGILVTTTAQVPEFSDRAFTSMSGMSAEGLPVVILVDARTMSAAEVLASALKESGRATLVGMPTFGKGSVQSPLPLGEHKGLLMVTIAKVFTASGSPLHGVGVAPHVLEPEPELQMRVAIGRAGELADAMR